MANPGIFTEASMLIRKPEAEVYTALADPSQTINFWFTKSSGNLREGERVLWEWDMYNAKAEVEVMSMQPFHKIIFSWGEHKRKVEINFEETSTSSTYVTICESGYIETGSELIGAIKDSTGGFTTVLDAMKAWLEHGIRLNLVADKYSRT